MKDSRHSRCNLCLTEKLAILSGDIKIMFNKRSETVNTHCHRKKSKSDWTVRCRFMRFVLLLLFFSSFFVNLASTFTKNRRDGLVARASASQSVDLSFILPVESYQKTSNNGIHSFPA